MTEYRITAEWSDDTMGDPVVVTNKARALYICREAAKDAAAYSPDELRPVAYHLERADGVTIRKFLV